MSEIIRLFSWKPICALVAFSLFAAGCQKDVGPTVRDGVLGLLTGIGAKHWIIDASNVDGREIVPSTCDSSYVLVLKSDFTWDEHNFNLKCHQTGNGAWLLNDENEVISIRYVNPGNGEYEEKHFEIEELSENYFAYQIADNNRLKYVRMKKFPYR
jgi:hypothetical protein